MSTPPPATATLREALEAHPVFAALQPTSVVRLAARAAEVRATAGARLVQRGEPGDALYLLLEGAVTVPVGGDANRPAFTARLQGGDVFGEMALLTGEPRSADVIAETAVRCARIDRADFEQLVRVEPGVAELLTTLLGARLLQADGIRSVGKYRLVAPLGVGGMSRVYQGVHQQLQRPVAVKMLDHALVHRGDFAERFRDEARIIASMRHPNIVDVYDVEEAWGTMFIIMDQLEGVSLDTLAADGPMDAADVRRIVHDVASALECAHGHGIVHRDVKPSNILVAPGPRACLTDFGVAVTAAPSSRARDNGRFFGTATYASPEHALGQPVDARSDIYSLGIVAWELLAGRPPFAGDRVEDVLRRHIHEDVPAIGWVVPTVPPDLATFIDRACARDPARRWSSCAELLDFLDRAAQRSSAPNHVRVRTLTLVFSPDAEDEVDRLLATVERMAAPIDGLRIKKD